MREEKWQQIRKIFDDALRQKPDERVRFVNEICGDNKTLLAEVESLLSSHDGADSFLETPAVAKVADRIAAETGKLEGGTRFGHYEIIEQIGRGGMGEVYLARDKKLGRQVAVKILNEKFSQHESNLNRFLQEAKAASALNHPLSLITNANLAGAYMVAGQNDRALEQARRTHELEPNFVSGQYWLALAYIANGMYAEAIAHSEKVLQTTDSTSQYMYMLRIAGYSYARSGRRREAEEVIQRFKDIAKTRYVKSYWVASIYAALGDMDKAFIELENAFAERDWDLHRLKVDPLMNPLRDEPRYDELVKRIGFK